tara:strand:+ start:1184 stop:1879 length:696 start_codon:yes stop_codon:yes gene_type:complete
MKTGGIIFSRMNSRRLPGKAMIPINGIPLLERVINRSKLISKIDHLCIATSVKKEDDIISSFGKSKGIDVYRGSLNDVTQRAIDTAQYFGYDNFIRICGDRPFLDHLIYDLMISTHLKNKNDLTTNIFPRTVPPGLTGEIVSIKSLKKMYSMYLDFEDKEHVTRYYYKNPSKFSILNMDFPFSKKNIAARLVIDDEDDLKRCTWIDKQINNNNLTNNTETIISLAEEWEKL